MNNDKNEAARAGDAGGGVERAKEVGRDLQAKEYTFAHLGAITRNREAEGGGA
ncbi:hypothetical protein [Methylocystis echinoides]|uniref:hypothetical protein n=1 Tax=Methylocystis echinoides TaxID=29468 RepID=UPI003440067F